MGMVHIAATFTPLIADKLALLPEGTLDNIRTDDRVDVCEI